MNRNGTESGSSRASVALPYGDGEVVAALPDGWALDLVAPLGPGDLPDPDGVLDEVFTHPLHSAPLTGLLSRSGRALLILAVERSWPGGPIVLDRVVSALRRSGISGDRLHLLVTELDGRPTSDEELLAWLEPGLSSGLSWSRHDPDGPVRALGVTAAGTPVECNARLFDFDLLIPIGRVRQHHLTGFSGGPELLFPGLASRKSQVRAWSAMLADGSGRGWREGLGAGRLRSNPLYHEMSGAIGLLPRPVFSIACIMGGRSDALAGIWAGDLARVHQSACRTYLGWKTFLFQEPYDLVLSASGGAPADGSLAGAASGLINACRLARPAGTVIHLSSCAEPLDERGWSAPSDPLDLRSLVERGDGFDRLAFSLIVEAGRRRILLASECRSPRLAQLGLEPVAGLEEALAMVLPHLPPGHRTALFPDADSVFPALDVD